MADLSAGGAGAGKRVLLIVSGGIAAYKSLELIRLLRKAAIGVRVVLTRGGAEFVTALSLQALCEDRVFTDLFSLTDESEMGHIQLSRSADLLVVVPASADILARMAAGIADDLATTVLLATDKPVLVAPAMNVRMWQHAATTANIATLTARGIAVIGPDDGAMACGEFGPGRLAEPEAIFAAIAARLAGSGALAGRHAIVTSGPTHEAIDPVRYIANRSSGRQGHAIARALASAGARVTLVTGPVSVADPSGVTCVHVESARAMHAAVEAALPADIAVFCAAVADWYVVTSEQKIKKSGMPPQFSLVENPDILSDIAHRTEGRPTLVIGFAAETEHLLDNATAKLARKGCDWIIANDVGAGSDVMGGEANEVVLVDKNGAEHWARASKTAIADRLVSRMIEVFS
ncbi:MAG: bifunctional phosphopantothenoylcysteine decarboxylase/phosphopantothenate synthase [Acidiphilium sp. 37-64-53]|uniref:bifunctional phosphopantothenoylcysteine decarboxylase/phosphopantothenate--cysteine ligase CoaBC n=1 Tax=Acidiphilium TaxID=522 RepID=UPI000BCC1CF4|nr:MULTISPECIES: bifunctional phosphopantothenoylcysteine decarboxylase/phosphopantothenate--cysteine ligase CoaBC [Acidiphilium]OYW04207.1 MAG: bifunctional phosphopantothenoylcysteine decarboxylase/phosphopantothenate synthase [Acidiphilium sp. 37-64-53]OZB31138.1 MAG: bifunctional phosphopantothenoylcysteine decarboxylase/phosphopantothenate synthase [Acidiphilium sp. 34-64-41]HQT83458.1 bifunctional phosphopantothenoylcysteine decarboxylase/phosphopantothenate--cysteine ligase CoaBC [Acidiph